MLEYVVCTVTIEINVSNAQDNAFHVLWPVASLEKGEVT